MSIVLSERGNREDANFTEAEAQAVIEVVAGKYQSMSAEQALKLASEDLRQRRLSKRRNEFLASLRATYPSTVAMEPPRLTRPIAAAQGQAIGPTMRLFLLSNSQIFQCHSARRAECDSGAACTRLSGPGPSGFKHFSRAPAGDESC